ncbi:MAG TPA: GNAT family N-acetyltransferase [Candidatus Limnocylindria bacterium]|nr:GNAT family N-acetyltransferase [Candidatus Limnocylindria bacterium]
MTPTLQADPDCARPPRADVADDDEPGPAPDAAPLRAERRAFDDIDPGIWDELATLSPYATPFSAWAFHRAWWDAYRDNATDETIVVVDPSSATPDRPVAILPLMDRHVVEPSDAVTHTMIRHGHPLPLTPLPEDACVIYFGATYHADYATMLAHPADMARAAEALGDALARDAIPDPAPPDPDHDESWAAVDLRRLRQADPATDALATVLGHREIADGWTLNVEREDVCPVIRLPEGADLDGFLATLGKKERHEIRRKVRRAEAIGPVELVESVDPLADLDAFIDLHQARWGAQGLFPSTPGGDQSRVFMRRLFELFGTASTPTTAPAAHATIHLSFLTVGGRRIGAAIHFETAGSILYYNAGVDPAARDLSPGVVLLERLVRRAIERGKCRVDLLRGDEPYKYEWGAVDEPIQRILVRRSVAATDSLADSVVAPA